MPLEPRPGMTVPIPCRHCDKSIIRFTVSEGAHSVACPRCNGMTDIRVYAEGPVYRIKTAKGPARMKPSSS